MLFVRCLPPTIMAVWFFSAAFAFAEPANTVLEEVIVTATLRSQEQMDVPSSLTVLTSQTLGDSGQQHFEDVLAQIPNLNWAAGSSRPRYFQIRGIGEREQYEGAPNPSVGFLIDDIDFSGVGMAATLFDVSQIEVLRGPQGTHYGANALAGLIAVHGAEPADEFQASGAGELGNYGMRSLEFVATAPVESLDSAWRLGVQKYRSDGFRYNAFLKRDDVNNRDELTARGKWRWQPDEGSKVDVTLLHANLNNGYDAFSIDNSRVTLSDHPGQDSQRATAGAIKWTEQLHGDATLTAIATTLDSKSVHAYDGDWGNAQFWLPFTYDYVYRADRDRNATSLEVRVASPPPDGKRATAWLAGVYGVRLHERIRELSAGTLIDPDPINGYVSTLDDSLSSRYIATNLAAFAQVDRRFANRWVGSLGLRSERRHADYQDAGSWGGDPNRLTQDSDSEQMLGGHASLVYEASDASRIYASIARGYKAGGFNLGFARQRQAKFKPESVWNYELGAKARAFDNRVLADFTLFYMQRKNMQVRSGDQLIAGDPNSFVFFTSNAAQGTNYGAEASLNWQVIQALQFGSSIGLLHTRAEGFLDDNGQLTAPREQAHAPNYQLQLNATWRRSGWMARVDVSAVDNFYFDVPPNPSRSDSYRVANLKFGYEAEHWSVYAWSRNVFNAVYATRGFYFGNEPPAFDDKLYIQNGDPRTVGIAMKWNL